MCTTNSLPQYSDVKDKLPAPVIDGNPGWCDLYDKCWEIAFSKNVHQPPSGSPLKNNWIDAGYSDHIFQWDTIFIMLFARYAHAEFPAINSLDNFYDRQRKSGYICREYVAQDGSEYSYDPEKRTGGNTDAGRQHTVNPPLFSWAEVEYFTLSRDNSRFAEVLSNLRMYADWLEQPGSPNPSNSAAWESNGRRSCFDNLYWNTNFGSGMDNSPRGLGSPTPSAWVDMSSQMAIMYDSLGRMYRYVGDKDNAQYCSSRREAIKSAISDYCWYDQNQDFFYYDYDGKPSSKGAWRNPANRVRTAAGFWPLLAGIPSEEQAEKIVTKYLGGGGEFCRPAGFTLFPTLSPEDSRFQADGRYWLGGVWAPINYMIIKGLQNYPRFEEYAAAATESYLSTMNRVFTKTEQVWENYQPVTGDQGVDTAGNPCRDNFVGWSGLGPISLLIENAIGIRVESPLGDTTGDTADISVSWKLRRVDRHGLSNLKIGDATISLVCAERNDRLGPGKITVTCDRPFTLTIEKISPLPGSTPSNPQRKDFKGSGKEEEFDFS